MGEGTSRSANNIGDMQPCITIFAPAQIRLPKPNRSSLFCLYRQHYYYDLYDYKHTDLLTPNESVVGCVSNAYRDEHVPRNNASISENTMPPVFPRTKRSQIWPHILTSILYHKIWYKSRWISQYIVIKSINIEKRADRRSALNICNAVGKENISIINCSLLCL